MDDERIEQLTAEVMNALRAPEPGASAAVPGGLEARMAALEAAMRGVAKPTTVAVAAVVTHPSLSLLGPETPPGSRCVMEPDKPCVQSGMCRTLGH